MPTRRLVPIQRTSEGWMDHSSTKSHTGGKGGGKKTTPGKKGPGENTIRWGKGKSLTTPEGGVAKN